MNVVEYNLAELKEEIVPYKPIIIAVTKYFGADKLIEAYNGGLRNFGENRVQDAVEKFAGLSDEIKENSRFHLIGHLQSNKVKKAVGFFDYIHSIDSLKLAEAVSEEAMRQGIVQKVLLQINNAEEEAKFGFNVEEIRKEFKNIVSLQGIKIEGLMNIAPICGDEELKILFKGMNNLKAELEKENLCKLNELSMGMSNDYKIALEEGSTMIRIGRKLFT